MNSRDYEALLGQSKRREEDTMRLLEDERAKFRALAAKSGAMYEWIEDWHEKQMFFEEDHPLWLIIRIYGWERYFPLKPDTFGL